MVSTQTSQILKALKHIHVAQLYQHARYKCQASHEVEEHVENPGGSKSVCGVSRKTRSPSAD